MVEYRRECSDCAIRLRRIVLHDMAGSVIELFTVV